MVITSAGEILYRIPNGLETYFKMWKGSDANIILLSLMNHFALELYVHL